MSPLKKLQNITECQKMHFVCGLTKEESNITKQKEDIEDTYSKNQMKYTREQKNQMEKASSTLEFSSRKQQSDLERQTEYLSQKYPNHTIILDIGSGINFERKGFKRILEEVFKGNIREVVVAHKDRFSRFGYKLFEWIFQQHGATLVCDKETANNQTEELSDDLMAIITVFTARYHGRRKYKTTGLL